MHTFLVLVASGNNLIPFACGARDKSKSKPYKNNGIDACNLWVPVISKVLVLEKIYEYFFFLQKSISISDV